MSRLIIASAAPFETAELVGRLTKAAIPVTNIITGIGHTQSTLIAGKLQNFVRGRDVVFCCTGGVIGPFISPIIFRASSVRLGSFDVRRGYSHLLEEFDPPCPLTGLPIDLPTCDVVNSLGVTLASEPAAGGAVTLETLELYGVARAWLPVARSFTAIVASTNATGPDARVQWRNNFKLAASQTADKLELELTRLMTAYNG
jgi:hypothetical protein